MKVSLSLLLLCLYSYSYGQKHSFNCDLLSAIVKSIDKEKQKIEIFRKIDGKYNLIEDDGKYKVQANEAYRNDAILDSLLKLPNILEIIDVKIDSIFYLSENIIIVDTFKFFTSDCNCKINRKKIIIINDMRKLPKLKNGKVISVYSLDNYRGYSCVFLKYKGSHRKVIKVAFFYLIERNSYVIKNIDVIIGYNIR